jgi:hypothetical protein
MIALLFTISLLLVSTTVAFLPPTREAGISSSQMNLFDHSSKQNDEPSTMFDRRAFLGTAGFLAGAILVDNPAWAEYGAGTNMKLPNYIDYLVEKNSQGAQDNTALYKGADPVVLLRRLQEADTRLQEVPKLAEAKKWSQIQGLLTGPLGTFGQTLNQIVTPDSDPKVQAASKKIKGDLIAIGQAASKKSDTACISMAQEASKDLRSFLELVF